MVVVSGMLCVGKEEAESGKKFEVICNHDLSQNTKTLAEPCCPIRVFNFSDPCWLSTNNKQLTTHNED